MFVVQGNTIPRQSSSERHSTKMSGGSPFLKPCRTRISLASQGGCFITGGQTGRQGLFIPDNEDTEFEREFVNANDPFYRPPISFDEFAGMMSFEEDLNGFDEDDTLARRLADPKIQLCQHQIKAAAKVILEDPATLIALYHLAIQAEGVDDEEQKHAARARIFNLFMRIVATMIQSEGAEKVNRKFGMHRAENGKTLIACLASLARAEKKKGYRHFTAVNTLKALGHNDPFASYLG
jgi:hypothetical protein